MHSARTENGILPRIDCHNIENLPDIIDDDQFVLYNMFQESGVKMGSGHWSVGVNSGAVIDLSDQLCRMYKNISWSEKSELKSYNYDNYNMFQKSGVKMGGQFA